MNFKTIVRCAKMPLYKRYFATKGWKVAAADGYLQVWEPSEDRGTWDIDDKPTDPPTNPLLDGHSKIIDTYSPPLSEMVKVNSKLFRAVISALEATKGQEPIYLQLNNHHICLAYENNGVLGRAVVACMRNEDAANNPTSQG